MTHTPGPWRLTISKMPPHGWGWCIEAGSIENGTYRTICQRGPMGHDAENIANAHLFFAAPDLLEALERLADDVENKWGDPHTLRHAHEAIAKYRQSARNDSAGSVGESEASLQSPQPKDSSHG